MSLKDLIDAGLLKAPLALFSDYKDTRLKATLQRDGTIRFGDESYDSPSSAASAARATVIGRRAATNGWSFWSYTDADGDHTLADARSRLTPADPS